MSNARVRMLRAQIEEQAERTKILESRLRRGEAQHAIVLSIEDMELVKVWYSWAEDEGADAAYSTAGLALMKRINDALDNYNPDAVS